MPAVLPLDPIELIELEPGFVNERGCTQRVAVTLAAQFVRGKLPQLVVHEHEHLLHDTTRERFESLSTHSSIRATAQTERSISSPAGLIGDIRVDAGLLTTEELARIQADMQRDTEDERVLVLAPPMSQVWARKPVSESWWRVTNSTRTRAS